MSPHAEVPALAGLEASAAEGGLVLRGARCARAPQDEGWVFGTRGGVMRCRDAWA
jgi:hypothetical protein